jgi:hypothetical protein
LSVCPFSALECGYPFFAIITITRLYHPMVMLQEDNPHLDQLLVAFKLGYDFSFVQAVMQAIQDVCCLIET